jgi:hypothetical protein
MSAVEEEGSITEGPAIRDEMRTSALSVRLKSKVNEKRGSVVLSMGGAGDCDRRRFLEGGLLELELEEDEDRRLRLEGEDMVCVCVGP